MIYMHEIISNRSDWKADLVMKKEFVDETFPYNLALIIEYDPMFRNNLVYDYIANKLLWKSTVPAIGAIRPSYTEIDCRSIQSVIYLHHGAKFTIDDIEMRMRDLRDIFRIHFNRRLSM